MKYIFAVLFSLSSLCSFSQLADGSFAPNFTTTDVYGNSHTLYDYLDEGYTVILQISAAWSIPDWNYSSNGVLQEIWEAHGPAGEPGVSVSTTDDVMILWVEGDASSAIDLENSDLGNWLAPNGVALNYPIINDDYIADLYSISYYPTIFTICPNRILKESGQVNAETHYANLSECIPPTDGINAALISLESTIEAAGCDAIASGNLSVLVQNLGTELLTSFTVEVFDNGESVIAVIYNGALEVYQTTTINFGNLSIDNESIQIEITSTDDNAADNVLTQNFEFNTSETVQTVTVNLLTDDFSNETYMQITDENGTIVWSEGNESIIGNYDTGLTNVPSDPTNPFENNQSYSWEVSLPSSGCYQFFIGDYYGDGLYASQWGGTDGNWSIVNHSDVILDQYSVFEGSYSTFFFNNHQQSWNCFNNACIDPLDGSGIFESLEECYIYCSQTNSQDCSDLFFSEYVEGTSNNKALEIYNPTSSAIDLSAYKVVRYANGAIDVSDEMTLSGTLNPYSTWVITNSDTNSTNEFGYIEIELYDMADQLAPAYPSPLYMNGDDAIGLTKNGVLIDLIGKIGEDPGQGWTNDASSGFTDANGGSWWTKNKTMIRKTFVNNGCIANPLLFNPETEWDTLAMDDWSNLGIHDCDCNQNIIYGCTNQTALNYNSTANVDDGSCIYSNQNPCEITPSGLYVDNVIHNRVRFNWAIPASAPSHYMIRYREVGTSAWTVMTAGTVNDDAYYGSSRTRYFMQPGTTYEWSMRARVLNSDLSINCQSPWSANAQYTTLPSCPNLHNQSVSTEANWVTFFAEVPNPSFGVWQSKGKIRELGSNSFRYVLGNSDGSISGLKGNFTESTNYEWHTKAWCTGNVSQNGSSDPEYHSGWGDFYAFNTEDLCDKMPTNFNTSSNTANTAVIMSWDTPESGAPDHYFLEMTNITSGQQFQWNNIPGTETSKVKYNQNIGDVISWKIRGACGTNGTSWATVFSQPEFYVLGAARLEDNITNTLKISPNPSRGIFNISLDTYENSFVEVKISNYLGKEIYATEFNSSDIVFNKLIDISQYADGMYLLTVKTNDTIINERIIVQ